MYVQARHFYIRSRTLHERIGEETYSVDRMLSIDGCLP